MRELHALAETYHQPPHRYYGLEGLAARMFDYAILWGAGRLPDDKPARGMEVGG